jgi:hypothetical protein
MQMETLAFCPASAAGAGEAGARKRLSSRSESGKVVKGCKAKTANNTDNANTIEPVPLKSFAAQQEDLPRREPISWWRNEIDNQSRGRQLAYFIVTLHARTEVGQLHGMRFRVVKDAIKQKHCS